MAGRPKYSTQNKEGKHRIRLEANKNVLELIRMRDDYMREGNKAKALEIILAMLPYQLPKLSSIEVSPDVSGTMELLQEIKQATLARGKKEVKQLEEGHDVNTK